MDITTSTHPWDRLCLMKIRDASKQLQSTFQHKSVLDAFLAPVYPPKKCKIKAGRRKWMQLGFLGCLFVHACKTAAAGHISGLMASEIVVAHWEQRS